MIKLTTIKSNPNNPRVIRDEKFKKLVKSIEEFPKMMALRPMVVNEEMVVLGGNMRLKALKELGYKEVPDEWVKSAKDLTDDEIRRFIIADNVGFGEHDWEMLANEWNVEELGNWGLDIPGFDLNADEHGTDFELPDGDKSPFQQMTFTLADEQATQIKNAIEDIKGTEEYKYAETMGNENSNGNALYLIIMQWAEQKK
jgi:ParB-like chromosome segregation protein Spo0J